MCFKRHNYDSNIQNVNDEAYEMLIQRESDKDVANRDFWCLL